MRGEEGESQSAIGTVDFDRDVRPILADNCFACHGPDEKARQANLRLDVREGALGKALSGRPAIVPGKPAASGLIERITTKVAPLRMPPASTGKRLTPAQIQILQQWIRQGAQYAPHWAFVPPRRPPLPALKIQNPKSKIQNPIDVFILARLQKAGLTLSPPADRYTLIRRLSFDLIGLPPTPQEVEAFVKDRSPDAYEKVVDRLLASPHFGERMALKWLDLARYADTHGYHIDSHRDMWPWRDWVINAFNRNMPFDQFVVEQLAGDLLPNATREQKIATGFNRNHPINFEGGAIPEEYHAAYIFDRIDTTATVFMALTMRCGQCHDHKYDPLTQKEYYRLYAFFHNVPEQGLDGQRGNAAPFIKVPTPEQEQKLAEYDRKIAGLESALKTRAAEAAPAQAEWEKTALAALEKLSVSVGLLAHYGLDEMSGEQARDALGQQPVGAIRGKPDWTQGRVGGALRFNGETHVEIDGAAGFERTDSFSYGAWIHPTSGEALTVLSRMDDANGVRGWDLFLVDGRVYVHLIHNWEQNALRVNTKSPVPQNQWTHVFVTYDGSSKAKGVKVYLNGKPAELDVTHDTLTDTIRTEKPLVIGRRNPGAPFKGLIDEVRIYNRKLTATEVAQLAGHESIRSLLTLAADQRTKEQQEMLAQFYLENHDEPYRRLSAELADWRKKRADLDKAIPTTMVMEEMEKPRDTFILIRGEYDKKGEKVAPGVPAVLPPLPKGMPANRLALAKWLVDPSHPLTARVAVNRFWQMLFGTGIVKTAEDFGTQGERPSHPELLDWLAVAFMTGEYGSKEYPTPSRPWDVKALLKMIVMSATYRQSSRVTPELLQKDPENRLLARGPRFRLPAEFVRDQALAASGLLVPRIGGPSVRPYQPPGLWEEISFKGEFTAQVYEQDHGEALYRRSMYTFWKRTCPPPSLQTFDAPEREFCLVRRPVTNTPLQALVLMNDPTFVEASRKFAERILTEAPVSPHARLKFAFRTLLARPPTEKELRVLMGVYNTQIVRFRKDGDAALKLLSVGESLRNENLDVAELAAWTAVANVLFNLDEAITKG